MNTSPTTAPALTREASHPLAVPGPARRRWVLSRLAGIVITGLFAPVLWFIISTDPDASLLPATAATAVILALLALGRWLRWSAWTQVPGAHARQTPRHDEPHAGMVFALARIVVLAATGLLVAQHITTAAGVTVLAIFAGLGAGAAVTRDVVDVVRRRFPRPFVAVLAIVESATPLIWGAGSAHVVPWAWVGAGVIAGVVTAAFIGLLRYAARSAR